MDTPSGMLAKRALVEGFAKLCSQGGGLPDVFAFLGKHPTADALEIAEVCALDQTFRWRYGAGLPVEVYLERCPELAADVHYRCRLIVSEYRCRCAAGQDPGIDDYLARFPDLHKSLRTLLRDENEFATGRARLLPTVAQNDETPIEFVHTLDPSVERDAGDNPPHPQPERIGRYQIQRILGDGGFGRVYLAYDDVLQRLLAIKVPHPWRITCPEDVDAYFTEARILASLDHPTIVPVYDFGRTEDGRCFAVSKYIEGTNLALKTKRVHLTYAAAAELIAHVADGLHYAHLRGIVHRDIKPANILIDATDRPYITDFGIALQEEDFGKERPTAGTPAYMSPEQIRGEGHLVDGRSDIFSLGIVLYELLTGRRPFGRTMAERLTPIDPRPPRQIDDSVPQELERICLKALSPRVADRYNTARDMAADLKHFVNHDGLTDGGRVPAAPTSSGTASKGSGDQFPPSVALTIVPKGLRSFDRDDAGFFLDLLPGPRDRDGLPENVHFWKSQLTESDPEKAFRVGLIYGPSGCGKSSLLKAGVIPRLPENIIPIYVEATPADTEVRLLKAIRKYCPFLPPDLGLVEALTVLRRGREIRPGTKVVFILDQFEQWLHARRKDESDELIRAIRQCDGIHLQCIVAVRDDFWMAVTRFMEELDVTLSPGQNIAAVDLFSLRHARKILTALGRVYGALPAGHAEINEEQKGFIEKAVRDLARDDQVIPVHLALFAEIVKNKPWVPATLEEVGGTEGVGVTFLEETFTGRAANPNYRLHEKAARAVLNLLLPEWSGSIKGGMRSFHELREASGYADRPRDFDVLLRILDTELRLITPTDPEGMDAEPLPSGAASIGKERFYHLTHDYLVPSLQTWLARKQKQTRRGRAELLLSERARHWSARPSHRSLPSMWEWLSILAFAPGRDYLRREDELRMLRAANRYHLARLAVVAVVLLAAGWWIHNSNDRTTARSLVDSLESAATPDVPGIIERMKPLRTWTESLLSERLQSALPDSRHELHLRMARLPIDRSQQDPLRERMLTAAPEALFAVSDVLRLYGDETILNDNLWSEINNPDSPSERRFRAGLALARGAVMTPDDESRWKQQASFLAGELVRRIADNPSQFAIWTEGFAPVRTALLGPLTEIFAGVKHRESEGEIAAAILAQFAADRPELLVDLLLQATPQQHRTLLPQLKTHASRAVALLRVVYDTRSDERAGQEALSQSAARRARAAVLLFDLGEPDPLWRAVGDADGPELQACAEERLATAGNDPELVLHKLLSNPSPRLRAALLRTLGSIPPDGLRPSLREECLKAYETMFRSDADAGVHSAAEWALRTWGAGSQLKKWKDELAGKGPEDGRQWYVTRNGQTMAVFKGPVRVRTGSPPDEPGRDDSDESFSTRNIGRDFALSTTEVSMEQFLTSKPDFRHRENAYTPSPDCPAVGLTWHRAAEYCQWLSRQEGIPESEWCYQVNIDAQTMVPHPDYLTRRGYRLPTEAEWEYCCRAGAATAFSWGNDPSISRRFAWTIENSGGRHRPVGSLCPNLFGMFDMHGNVAEWIQESFRQHLPAEGDDVELSKAELASADDDDTERVNRGGSAAENVQYQRAANRRPVQARSQASFHIGFRVARTLK